MCPKEFAFSLTFNIRISAMKTLSRREAQAIERQVKVIQKLVGMPAILNEFRRQEELIRAASPAYSMIVREFHTNMGILTANPIGPYLTDINRKFSEAVTMALSHTNSAKEVLNFQNRIFNELNNHIRILGSYDLQNQTIEEIEEEVQNEVKEDIKEILILAKWEPIRITKAIFDNPTLLHSLSSRNFEEYIAFVIEELGFTDVKLTPRSNDRGRDILAVKCIQGIPFLLAFECKRYSPHRKIGPEILRSLLGTISHGPTQADKGVLITTSSFTKGAKKLILSESRIDGKDYTDLLTWIEKIRAK